MRHDTTAKHLAWGGVIVGATLGVLFPPLGYAALAGGALDAAVLGTAGGLSGHLWKAIPRDDLRELGGILEAGQAALAAQLNEDVFTIRLGVHDLEPPVDILAIRRLAVKQQIGAFRKHRRGSPHQQINQVDLIEVEHGHYSGFDGSK